MKPRALGAAHPRRDPASRTPLQLTLHVRAVQALSIAALLLAWEGVARAGWVDPLFVPAPSAVARAFGRIGRAAFAGLGDTLLKTAIAYVLAVVIGVGGGILLGSVRGLRQATNPFVVALYGMPKILVLPWIVLFFGFGATPAVVYATIHGVFPILVLVTGAVRDVDRNLLTVARAFGARRWQLYWKVVLPAIVPTVLAAMRLGIVFCLLGVLVVEMFAGVRGMGYVLSSLANGFQAPELFAATALVSAASIVIVLSLDALNDRLSQWRGES
jgi:ABC-type nitrate/sulfonate/bicarbonate transport system permease component